MATTSPFEYAGSELALFEKAVNWKRYWSVQIAPFLRGRQAPTAATLWIRVPH